MSEALVFIVSELQDEVFILKEIVKMLVAKQEGIEADNIDELFHKLLTKCVDEAVGGSNQTVNEK